MRDINSVLSLGDTSYYGYEWIGLDDLKLVRSWQENSAENLWKGKENFNITGGHLGTIFDNSAADTFVGGFLVRELDGPFRWVRCSRPLENLGPFEFLTSRLIVSEGQNVQDLRKGTITLVRVNGDVVFQQEFSDREILKYLNVSADGGRFAIAVYRVKGGSLLLDIPGHSSLERIMVFDVGGRRWVYTINPKSQGIKDVSELTLSPDGGLLALLSDDGILRLFRLPPGAMSFQ